MIKKNLWPYIHRFQFHPRLENCWGFLNQNDIHLEPRKTMIFRNRKHINKSEFKKGVKRGYKIIFDKFYQKENFLKYSYTTPKLSIALNYLHTYKYHPPPYLNFNRLHIHILNSNIEYGISKTNDKILGLWSTKYMKQEIIIGMIGPEFQSIWHQQPIRENINVLYYFPNRFDIWTWQRCLLTEDSPWVIYNINNIILS